MEGEFIQEQKYLDDTYKVVEENVAKLEEAGNNGYEYVQELSKYDWEDRKDEFVSARTREDINNAAISTNQGVLRKLRMLRRIVDKLYPKEPYFGKIVVDYGDDKESFYIGFTSIMNNDEIVVNDWRSPIASLFYNSKIGNTSYKAPNGMVLCNLLQRKQININPKERKIIRIIDSDIHLSDDALQEVLGKNSDDKMKSIVKTIQEEQNEVIRNIKDKKIIVQGCAGSGKTSVALHRLSYLLHNDQNSKSENMLIFSPSDTFSSYISNVLPDLGDNNVLQTTFSDFANSFIKKFDKIESFSEFLSKYYNNENSEIQNKLNKFKFSKEYKEALEKFIKRNANSYRFRDDLQISSGITIPNDYLNKCLDNDNNSMQDKIDMLTDEVCRLLNRNLIMKKSQIRNKIIKELIKPEIDPRAIYNKFLNSQEFIDAFGQSGNVLNKKLLEYPDMIGILYLYFELMGYPLNDQIHHLVIDEVQDYVPIQMEMIAKMFDGASITVLGDANQTINPYHKYDSLEEMKEQLGLTTKYIELNKAYRSSPEIMNYVKEVIDEEKIKPIRNSSNNPVEIKEVDKSELFTTLVSDILKLKEKGFNRICIITKSIKEAKAIYEGLKGSVDNIKILCDEESFDTSIMVAPSYNSKGLEFDAIICYNDYDNSYTEDEKYLYYVACTRAQHDLVVYNEPKILRKER